MSGARVCWKLVLTWTVKSQIWTRASAICADVRLRASLAGLESVGGAIA